MTRIVMVTSKQGGIQYVPQHENGNGWMEYLGYDADSPYIHPKTFKTKEDAQAFLKATAAYEPGKYGWGTVEVC